MIKTPNLETLPSGVREAIGTWLVRYHQVVDTQTNGFDDRVHWLAECEEAIAKAIVEAMVPRESEAAK